jgi:hypothetical protein
MTSGPVTSAPVFVNGIRVEDYIVQLQLEFQVVQLWM